MHNSVLIRKIHIYNAKSANIVRDSKRKLTKRQSLKLCRSTFEGESAGASKLFYYAQIIKELCEFVNLHSHDTHCAYFELLFNLCTRFEELLHLLVSFWTDRSNLYRKILWCYYLSVIKYICK